MDRKYDAPIVRVKFSDMSYVLACTLETSHYSIAC